MYMTRDKTSSGIIELWNCSVDELFQTDVWWENSNDNLPICLFWPKEFKQLFPKQKLPRKGSCKYVELRLYIPEEG